MKVTSRASSKRTKSRFLGPDEIIRSLAVLRRRLEGEGRRPVCPCQLWITVYGLGSGGSGSTGSHGSRAAFSYFFAKFMWYSRTASGTKGTCK